MRRAHIEYWSEEGSEFFYRWHGPAYLPVAVAERFHYSFGKSFPDDCPFPVRKVRQDLLSGGTVYARCGDLYFFSWLWWWSLARLAFPYQRLLSRVYRAARSTGWFHPTPGEVMSWGGLLRSFGKRG